MYFHNFTNFLHMGGYADYVWSAYVIAAALLIGIGWYTRFRLRVQIKCLRKLYE